MKSQCEICTQEAVFERTFFKCTDRNNRISLCDTHNREMFLIFCSKYPEVLSTRKFKKFTPDTNSMFNKERN